LRVGASILSSGLMTLIEDLLLREVILVPFELMAETRTTISSDTGRKKGSSRRDFIDMKQFSLLGTEPQSVYEYQS
jgi:hypothetical protein